MRFLVAPDSFKGSLTALEVATALGEGIGDGHSVRLLPLADGGDGSVDAAVASGFRAVAIRVPDARGELHDTTLALSADGRTAVVEVANTCGLALLGPKLEPLTASTVGLGEALRAAVDLVRRAAAPRRVVLALGGSASTDGGTGLLTALGVRLLDDSGAPVEPGAAGLALIRRIDASELFDLSGVELICATDVTSPLTGPTGAAAVFGPQKGLDEAAIAQVDAALAALVPMCAEAGFAGGGDSGGASVAAASVAPGSGAAGGTGFACLLLKAEIVSGADFFLDLLGFSTLAHDEADLVVTGEGRIDAQTSAGKLVSAVARRAAPVPVVAVVGSSLLQPGDAARLGLADVIALADLTTGDPANDPQLTRSLLVAIGRRLAGDVAPDSILAVAPDSGLDAAPDSASDLAGG